MTKGKHLWEKIIRQKAEKQEEQELELEKSNKALQEDQEDNGSQCR
jgi:hypothetical protein